MSSQILTQATAGAAMEPLNRTAVPTDSARDALEIMEAEDLPLLPVVQPDTGRFTGAVLRRALENGCVRMGHDPSTCDLHNHLNRNVVSCAVDDLLDERLLAALRKTPIVVLDDQHRPRGFVRARTGRQA